MPPNIKIKKERNWVIMENRVEINNRNSNTKPVRAENYEKQTVTDLPEWVKEYLQEREARIKCHTVI